MINVPQKVQARPPFPAKTGQSLISGTDIYGSSANPPQTKNTMPGWYPQQPRNILEPSQTLPDSLLQTTPELVWAETPKLSGFGREEQSTPLDSGHLPSRHPRNVERRAYVLVEDHLGVEVVPVNLHLIRLVRRSPRVPARIGIHGHERGFLWVSRTIRFSRLGACLFNEGGVSVKFPLG